MDTTPDPRRVFLERVVAFARKLGLFEDVFPDPDRFAVILRRDGALHHCALENLHLTMREQSPDDRSKTMSDWLDVMTREHRPPETWEEARPHLRAVLRTPGLFATSWLEHRRQEFVLLPVTPMLRCALVLDLPQRMAWLRREELRAWGVSPELARHVALENLADDAAEGVEPYDPTALSPLWPVNSEDGYESSRLLLPGWLASFVGKVDGPPVAAVPHRNALLVTGGGIPENIERLARIARDEYAASPGPVSPALYTVTRDGEGLQPLRLPHGHPAGGIVEEGHARMRATEYEEQRAVLGELGDRTPAPRGEDGAPLGLAPVEVWRRRADNDDVDYMCATRWEQGVEALLPEVDVVRLLHGDEERQVPWEQLQERWPGALEEVEHLDPPRWRTMRWPDEGEARGMLPT